MLTTHKSEVRLLAVLGSRRRGVLLTDPVFSDRASPFRFSGPKRVVPPAYTADTLPKVDILIVSHAHYDHLDLPGLKRLATLQSDIRVVVPLGLARYLRRAGFTDVTEIDWWQNTERDGTTITATPVRHWASRSPFDRNKTLWAGFMFRFEDGYQFYFAGDAGYSADFTETRKRLGAPDFAAIPIGSYEPHEFMRETHCKPEEAVQIFQLKAYYYSDQCFGSMNEYVFNWSQRRPRSQSFSAAPKDKAPFVSL